MDKQPFGLTTYAAVVGAVLSAIRKELEFSQSDISDAIGVTVSTWSRIERGESALAIDQLAKAARALKTTPGAILQIADEKVSLLSQKGIETSDDRSAIGGVKGLSVGAAAGIAASGAIPIMGTSLFSAIGTVIPFVGAVAGVAALASSILVNSSASTQENTEKSEKND